MTRSLASAGTIKPKPTIFSLLMDEKEFNEMFPEGKNEDKDHKSKDFTRASFVQKRGTHRRLDAIWESAPVFHQKYFRSLIYQALAILLIGREEYQYNDVAGIIDPFAGDHHIKNLVKADYGLYKKLIRTFIKISENNPEKLYKILSELMYPIDQIIYHSNLSEKEIDRQIRNHIAKNPKIKLIREKAGLDEPKYLLEDQKKQQVAAGKESIKKQDIKKKEDEEEKDEMEIPAPSKIENNKNKGKKKGKAKGKKAKEEKKKEEKRKEQEPELTPEEIEKLSSEDLLSEAFTQYIGGDNNKANDLFTKAAKKGILEEEKKEKEEKEEKKEKKEKKKDEKKEKDLYAKEQQDKTSYSKFSSTGNQACKLRWENSKIDRKLILEYETLSKHYPAASIHLADYYHQNKDDKKAFTHLLNAGDKFGDPESLFKVGVCYHEGTGTRKDDQKALEYFTKASELGYEKATLMVLKFQKDGIATKKDDQKAENTFQNLVDTIQDPEICNRLAVVHLHNKNLPEAKRLCEIAIKGGNIDAFNTMGRICEHNHNFAEAFRYYKEGADNGNSSAQFNLGFYYAIGNGIEKDFQQSVKWFTKAAEKGIAEAQFNLGVCYEKGNGVEKDLKQSVQWFTKAAEQGFARAQFSLGICYAQGIGVEKNQKKAIELYTQAAEQGYSEAQLNLGVCYEKGDGIKQDLKKAVELYTQAAGKGLAEAQLNLGICYTEGNGIKQDLKKAVEFYTQAAEQGNATAQSNLGICYAQGIGVEENQKKAIELYTLAAGQGNADAQSMLGFCYARGIGVEKNQKKAIELYTKAAEQGLDSAQYFIGIIYKQGNGVEKNQDTAIDWFTKSARLGNLEAKAELDILQKERKTTDSKNSSQSEIPWFTQVEKNHAVLNMLLNNSKTLGNESTIKIIKTTFETTKNLIDAHQSEGLASKYKDDLEKIRTKMNQSGISVTSGSASKTTATNFGSKKNDNKEK